MNLIPYNLPIVQKSEQKTIAAPTIQELDEKANEFYNFLFQEKISYTIQDIKVHVDAEGFVQTILYYSTYQLTAVAP